MDASVEVVPSTDLDADIDRYERQGYRLDVIFPADAPRVAELSLGDTHVRLEGGEAPAISSGADGPVLTRGGEWGTGRAGLQYRDLIPDRHGGDFIASHIRIADPGPVPDYVHHHAIDFQMIFCRRGRVEVVYQDQGPSFWMDAGDCVLQPPHIRHRVLTSDDRCEVVEIASPAEHPTFRDHDLQLPTNAVDVERDFDGQRFSFDRRSDLAWEPIADGWHEKVTGIGEATGGLGLVRTVRGSAGSASLTGSHGAELLLLYVLDGAIELDTEDRSLVLASDDSLSLTPGASWEIRAGSAGAELLWVQIDRRT